MNMGDGMTYAPKGQPSPVVKPGEFCFAAAYANHGHIYGMCNGLTEAGGILKYIYDPDRKRAENLQKAFPGAILAESEEQILSDPEIRLVASAAVTSERCAVGLRVMEAGKDYFTDKAPFTTLAQLESARETVRRTGQKYMVYYSERLHSECAVYAGDLKAAVNKLREWCRENGCHFRMRWVPANEKALLETLFPGMLQITSDRDHADYIYERERLRTLAGRKLQSKRNFVNRIKKQNWSYEPITLENMPECQQVQQAWCRENNHCVEGGPKEESCAVQQAFRHFNDLGFSGGCVRLDGKVIAYTIGEPLNSDTFIVHIEKALSGIPGAYPLINQQFVEHAMEGFTYVNREDDTGDEGLRKAKLSYDPCRLFEDYVIEFAREEG